MSSYNWVIYPLTQPQVANQKKAIHAIRLIRKYFNPDKLKMLIKTNCYSILYYNCIFWLIPALGVALKQLLLSVPISALRLCGKVGWSTSFEKIHSIYKRATPMKLMLYKHALELYYVYNGEEMNDNWMNLNHQQNCNGRIQCVQIIDKSSLRVGRNVSMNRLSIISNRIDYD